MRLLVQALWRPEEDIRSLELELQVVVNHRVGSGNRTLYLLDMENNTIMNSVDMFLF